MKKLWVGILFAVIGLVPTRASAAPVGYLQADGMGHRAVVTIDGLVSGTYYAGEINWTWSGPTPGGLEDSIFSYCVDILNEVTDPQKVTLGSTNDLPNTTPDAGGKAAWLFNAFANTIRDSSSPSTNIWAAALQVAIWEALYDATPDLNTGNFSLVTSAGVYGGQTTALAIYSQANYFLGQLFYGNGQYHTSEALWLDAESPNHGQDQITQVPEPGTLLILGLGAVMAVGRRFGQRPTLA